MSGLDELIARLEKATGEDRQLNYAIEREVAPDNSLPTPNYTGSIDAALTLVPEGFYWASAPAYENREASVYQPFDGTVYRHYTAEAKTTALALCIASLKARAPNLPEGEK